MSRLGESVQLIRAGKIEVRLVMFAKSPRKDEKERKGSGSTLSAESHGSVNSTISIPLRMSHASVPEADAADRRG